jgi:hypothetical protein
VVVHVILSCIFIRTKSLKAADGKLWILAVMIFGPIAWLFWWFRHRNMSHSQTPGTWLNQPLLAECEASAPPPDDIETPIAKVSAAASAAVAFKPHGARAVASAPSLGISDTLAVKPSAAVVAVNPHVVQAGSCVVKPAVYDHQQLGVLAFQAPNYDDISALMTDQCLAPPSPPSPTILSFRFAGTVHLRPQLLYPCIVRLLFV